MFESILAECNIGDWSLPGSILLDGGYTVEEKTKYLHDLVVSKTRKFFSFVHLPTSVKTANSIGTFKTA